MSIQRSDIISGACRLYLEVGLEGFSMRKLARRLGVTAPALYRHYENREEVMGAVVGEALSRYGQYLYRALAGGTPFERLRMAVRGNLDFAIEHSRLYEVVYASHDLMGMETAFRAKRSVGS